MVVDAEAPWLPAAPHMWSGDLARFGKDLHSFTKFGERTYAITKTDRVYVTTSGKRGMNCSPRLNNLGLGRFVREANEPVELLELRNQSVVKLCSSKEHTLVLTAKGHLWAWGVNDDGKLGLGHRKNEFVPKKLAFELPAFDNIVCGHWSSFALTTDGRVFGWGYNKAGQLALDRRYQVWTRPTLINTLPEKIVQLEVSVMFYYALALSDTGKVYGFGACQDHKPRLIPVAESNTTRAIQLAGTWNAGFILTSDGVIHIKANCQVPRVFYRSKRHFIVKIFTEQTDENDLLVAVTSKFDYLLWKEAYDEPQLHRYFYQPEVSPADAIAYAWSCPYMNIMLKPHVYQPVSTTPAPPKNVSQAPPRDYVREYRESFPPQQICLPNKGFCLYLADIAVFGFILFDLLFMFILFYLIKKYLTNDNIPYFKLNFWARDDSSLEQDPEQPDEEEAEVEAEPEPEPEQSQQPEAEVIEMITKN